MPLTEKGRSILDKMRKTYGSKKGEEVFYASANAGKITGVHESRLAGIARKLREEMFPHLKKARR
jgi:hypothetical protein